MTTNDTLTLPAERIPRGKNPVEKISSTDVRLKPVETQSQAPSKSKRTAKELINDHGPSGWLIVRLQRYTLLGWLLFFLVSSVFVVYVMMAASRPVPVIAVDESGRVLGSFEYLNPTMRTDVEITNGAKHWLQYYYSLNSKTIFEDYTSALNMMDESLRQAKLKEVIDLNYLKQIEDANTRSHIEYQIINLVNRKGLSSVVELSGNIIIDNGLDLIDKPFYIQLTMNAVSRSTLGQLGTFGLKVLSVVEK